MRGSRENCIDSRILKPVANYFKFLIQPGRKRGSSGGVME